MGFIAHNKGGEDFAPVPAGVFIARCYELIDLGTQTEESGQYAGNVNHKIRIGFEILDKDSEGKPLTITVDNVEKPMAISKTYTMSMSEKSNLRKDLAAWRGKQFSDDEADAFDVSKLLGAFCMLNITHKVSGKGKTYANISGISPIPSALKDMKPKPFNKDRMFDLDKPDMDMFNAFPDFIKEMIRKSPEWMKLNGGSAPPASAPKGFDDFEDDIPF